MFFVVVVMFGLGNKCVVGDGGLGFLEKKLSCEEKIIIMFIEFICFGGIFFMVCGFLF